MKRIILFVALIFITTSCGTTPSNYKPESTGTPYEIFVVSNAEEWNGALGDTLRAVLGRDMEMLNQPEPYFSLKNVTKASLNQLINKHRNLILIRISDTVKQTRISADYDIKAAPQVVVYMDSQSTDSLAQYVHDNQDKLIKFLDKTEQDRFVDKMTKFPALDVNQFVEKMFGVKISIPKGYVLRNSIGDNFAWISYEMPFASQGVIIYSYPYTPETKFTAEYLVKIRNQFVAQVPGPLEGTYMTTSDMFVPDVSVETINGMQWIEMKGFWDVKNDFMGGPFRSYTTIDKLNGRVFTIDTYVFSPKTSKGRRNYMKQLEAIVKTVKF